MDWFSGDVAAAVVLTAAAIVMTGVGICVLGVQGEQWPIAWVFGFGPAATLGIFSLHYWSLVADELRRRSS